ncbi:unnamed protein product [Cochlearia groenlandica]
MASSSKARDLELDFSRKAEANFSNELEAYKKRYRELFIRDSHEFAMLRRSRYDCVEAAKDQFSMLREVTETRLRKLRDSLDVEEGVRKNQAKIISILKMIWTIYVFRRIRYLKSSM